MSPAKNFLIPCRSCLPGEPITLDTLETPALTVRHGYIQNNV